MKLNVTTARIHGLNDEPYWFEHRLFYAWAITFSDCLYHNLFNLDYIKVGDTEKKDEKAAKAFCQILKENFKKANIEDESKVAILYTSDFKVLAIAHIEKDFSISSINDLKNFCWIDVRQQFTAKSFEELCLFITNLSVY